jgi:hypothetical protein
VVLLSMLLGMLGALEMQEYSVKSPVTLARINRTLGTRVLTNRVSSQAKK